MYYFSGPGEKINSVCFLRFAIIQDVRLRINGERHTIPRGLTIAALLEHLDIGQRRVAVELNRAVIPRAEHVAVRLVEGDEVEIVHAIGGG